MIDISSYTTTLSDRTIEVSIINRNNKITWGAFEQDIVGNLSTTPLKYFARQGDGTITISDLLEYNQSLLVEQFDVKKFKREIDVTLESDLIHTRFEYTIKFQQRNCFNTTVGTFVVTFRKPMSTRRRLNLMS